VRSLIQKLGLVAVAAVLGFGLTMVDSHPARADLHFSRFIGDCQGGCNGVSCCYIAPPIIVNGG